jgi:hypothetical protein
VKIIRNNNVFFLIFGQFNQDIKVMWHSNLKMNHSTKGQDDLAKCPGMRTGGIQTLLFLFCNTIPLILFLQGLDSW